MSDSVFLFSPFFFPSPWSDERDFFYIYFVLCLDEGKKHLSWRITYHGDKSLAVTTRDGRQLDISYVLLFFLFYVYKTWKDRKKKKRNRKGEKGRIRNDQKKRNYCKGESAELEMIKSNKIVTEKSEEL